MDRGTGRVILVYNLFKGLGASHKKGRKSRRVLGVCPITGRVARDPSQIPVMEESVEKVRETWDKRDGKDYLL